MTFGQDEKTHLPLLFHIEKQNVCSIILFSSHFLHSGIAYFFSFPNFHKERKEN